MRAEIVGDSGTGPVLVYLPGMDGTGELLLGTAERLATRFRLVRFAYVDEGQRASAAIYERLADTAATALTNLGVTRAAVLAESFGGGVALQLALRHGSLVKGLALVNTFAWYPGRIGAGGLAAATAFAPAPLLGLASRLGWRLAGRRMFIRPRRDTALEQAFGELATGSESRGFKTRLRSIRFLDLRSRLREVDVPCLLFASECDRIVPSRSTMALLDDELPRSRLISIPNAGHIVLPLPDEPWLDRLLPLADA